MLIRGSKYPFEKCLRRLFMGGRGKFERVCVDSYSLCVGFYSRYGCCYRCRVGLKSLYVGCACAMWAVTASMWAATGAMGDVTGARWATQALHGLLQSLCGMLHPLCGLFQALWGLLHAPGELHRRYVGCYNF